jgi:hypothetical protein
MHKLTESFQKCASSCITIKNLFNLKTEEADQLICAIQNLLDIAERKNFPSPLILGVLDLAEASKDSFRQEGL